MNIERPEDALAARREPSDIAAGFMMTENGSTTVVRVVKNEGDLALVLDDGGGVPKYRYLGSMLSRQELIIVERFRKMPGGRRFTFLALSELLALAPNDERTLVQIVNDAVAKYAGESTALDIIGRKAFRDAARALAGEA